MESPNNQSHAPDTDAPRWRVWGCLALLLVGLQLGIGPTIQLARWQVTRSGNSALDEALQWKHHRLALSHANPRYEAPTVEGKQYNVVGLAFLLLSLVGTTITSWAGGAPDSFYPPYYVACVALPLPWVGYWAFRKMVGSPAWAAVLTAYLIAGTCCTPVLAICGSGSIYYINHILAVTGLLIVSADLLGSRRIWPSLIGLCLAVWSRQMTCLYVLPLLWIAWHDRKDKAPEHAGNQSKASAVPHNQNTPISLPSVVHASHRIRIPRKARLALAGIAFIAAVPMTLNTLKFGNPFDTGYPRMYQERTDRIGRRAQQQFMGLRYVPEHARAMNLAFPRWDIRAGTLFPDATGITGASIWLTSPLLLAVFITIHRWWGDGRRRVLMLSTLPVIAGLMCYHTTGADNAGYYRYALDFIPIWLMVIAPYTIGRWGRPLTLACLAYSALYFHLLPP